MVDPLRPVSGKHRINSRVARVREGKTALIAVDAPSAGRPFSVEKRTVRRMDRIQNVRFPDCGMNARSKKFHSLRLQKTVYSVSRPLNGLAGNHQIGTFHRNRKTVESLFLQLFFRKRILFQRGFFSQKNHIE